VVFPLVSWAMNERRWEYLALILTTEDFAFVDETTGITTGRAYEDSLSLWCPNGNESILHRFREVEFDFDIASRTEEGACQKACVVAGILGLMLSWQWTYMTSVYWVSFFVAGRQHHITRGELYTYIGTMNAPWVLFALLGLYVSVRLILDGNYSVLGY